MSLPDARRERAARRAVGSRGSAADPVAATTQKLQKVLADAGLGSRREMEQWIAAGRISVNGQVATLGTRVGPDDAVLVDRRPLRQAGGPVFPRVLIYHKPEGEIVSRDDPGERKTVFENLPRAKGGRWIAIGRLDYNTEGLLVFTTSGELANRLMHPGFSVEREYAVRLMGELAQEQMDRLTNGIELEDGPAHFDRIAEEGGDNSNRWYRVVIREGRNREIRRMFSTVGLMVSRLIRVRFGMINLPSRLRRGQMQELDVKQVAALMQWAGLPVPEHLPQRAPRKGVASQTRARRATHRQ